MSHSRAEGDQKGSYNQGSGVQIIIVAVIVVLVTVSVVLWGVFVVVVFNLRFYYGVMEAPGVFTLSIKGHVATITTTAASTASATAAASTASLAIFLRFLLFYNCCNY